MVKLTRIYTKGGDKGLTSLGSGKRVAKHDPRVEAYGEVDEANAAVGLARLHFWNPASLGNSRQGGLHQFPRYKCGVFPFLRKDNVIVL